MKVTAPQFDRPPTMPQFPPPPSSLEDWILLRETDTRVLQERGMQLWEHMGRSILLFPAEWYPWIPRGYEIVNVFGDVDEFEPGETDDDRRMGCLAYGIPSCELIPLESETWLDQAGDIFEARGCSPGHIHETNHSLLNPGGPPLRSGIVVATERPRPPGKVYDARLIATCTESGMIRVTTVASSEFRSSFHKMTWT